MTCDDIDCRAGGGGFDRPAAAAVLIQDGRVPLEFIQDAGESVRLSGASFQMEGPAIRDLMLRFDSGPRVLAYMIVTVEFLEESGETASYVVTVDRTFQPSPLVPSSPLVIPASAHGRTKPAKLTLRLDYVRFLGEAAGGLYASSLDQRFKLSKRALLGEIRRVHSRIGVSVSQKEALAALPSTPEFSPFRGVLLQGGVHALRAELLRVGRLLADLGID